MTTRRVNLVADDRETLPQCQRTHFHESTGLGQTYLKSNYCIPRYLCRCMHSSDIREQPISFIHGRYLSSHDSTFRLPFISFTEPTLFMYSGLTPHIKCWSDAPKASTRTQSNSCMQIVLRRRPNGKPCHSSLSMYASSILFFLSCCQCSRFIICPSCHA